MVAIEKMSFFPNCCKSIKNWIVKNPLESIFFLLIILIGAFLRLYKISDYMTFLGDEGRDVIVVRRLLVEQDLVFIGPGTSVGDMYLGPIYYYLMAPFLYFANYSPVGPSVMVALIGVATIFLIFYISKKWFGKESDSTPRSLSSVNWGAVIASFLYAISPTVIIFSRHSWNPNIMPFFALLFIYSVWQFFSLDRYLWIILASLSFAVILQSHYLGGILFFVFILFWILKLRQLKKGSARSSFLRYSGVSILIFILLMSPLLLFDAKHQWHNLKSFETFINQTGGNVVLNTTTVLGKFNQNIVNIFTRLVNGYNRELGIVLLLFMISIAIVYFFIAFKGRRNILKDPVIIVISWILIGVLGLSFYRQSIYDHYYGFMFPAFFLLIAQQTNFVIVKFKKSLLVPLLFLFVLVVGANIYASPLKAQPQRQLKRTMEITEKIIYEAGGKKFNFAVIANQNYEGAYQYFLELWNAPFVIIDPQKADETIMEQLFVVCEYQDRQKCQPTSNPKAQIANFGWSRIDKSWEVGGAIVYKLTRNESGKP